MTDEERQWNRNMWSYENAGRRETASDIYRRTRGYWHEPEDEVRYDKMATIRDEVLRQELRLRDIRDSYRMMELNPSHILEKLQARGTCTIGEPPEPKEVKEVEEDDSEEFLFDPKELDL